jgi:predicted membrane protein DUF2306
MAMGASAHRTRRSSPSAATLWLRPKYALFGFIGLLLLYVLQHNERFLIDFQDEYWDHLEKLGLKWWLLPHAVAGASALLLGPMQFSDRLRTRYLWLHRVVGRVYVTGTFIAAPLGVYLQYLDEANGDPRSFTIETAFQGGLWFLTTAIAWVLILKGKTQLHRQWMTRSFGTGPLIFLEVRVIGGVFNITGPAFEYVVWACTLSSIFVADALLLVQDLLRTAHRRMSAEQPPAVVEPA